MTLVFTSIWNYKGQKRKETSVKTLCKKVRSNTVECREKEHGVKENTGSNASCVMTGKLFCLPVLSFIAVRGNNGDDAHLRGYGEDCIK